MKTRIISGIIGIILLFIIIYLGSPIYNLSILILTLIGLYEYNKAIDIIKDKKVPHIMNIIYSLILFLIMFFKKEEYIILSLFIYILMNFCEYVLDRDIKIKDLALSLLGGIYIVFLMSYLYYFADTLNIWYVFLIASGSDIFAYFTGKLIGKTKLAPILSPKKTVEGFIGGIIGAIILVIIFAKNFNSNYLILLSIMAVLGSIASVFGDIFASKIKRETGLKDYGNIMPGHGGVLDRFDSILFTAPIVYYFFKFIIK